MKNKPRQFLLFQIGPIIALLLATIWDAGSTYATIGHKLHLDGNPFIRSFNWSQLVLLQSIFVIIPSVLFLLSWEKQKEIWPLENKKFISFLFYLLKKGFSCNFSWAHIKTEFIYAGSLAIWILIFAHLLAAIITTSPLLGGPGFWDIGRLTGLKDLNLAQNITTILIIVFFILLAHYPLYRKYNLETRQYG